MGRTDAGAGARNAESGFSLIELMFGMAILVSGLLILGLAMTISFRLERSTNERRAALDFATSQIERVRGMPFNTVKTRPRVNNASPADPLGSGGYLPETAWNATNVGTAPGTGIVGFRRDTDGDGDEDIFGLNYYRQTTSGNLRIPVTTTLPNGWNYTLSDPRLDSLVPQDAAGGRVAEVVVRDSDASTGLVEGSGYWVTVRVYWKGSRGGNEEARMSTFVAR